MEYADTGDKTTGVLTSCGPEVRMKRYCIKSNDSRVEFVDVLKEIEDGFLVRYTRQKDGYEKITEDTMSRHLLDICLKTGYIYEPAMSQVVA